LVDLPSVETPSKAVELDIDPGNLLLVVRDVKQIEAVDIVAAAAHAAKLPLPEALVAVCDVDLAGFDVFDWVLLYASEPRVAIVEDVGVDLQRLVSALLREGSDGMGWGVYVVVRRDQRVDGAGAFAEVSREVFLVGGAWGLVLVAPVLKDGYECVDDVVAIIFGQSASVRGIVEVVAVDVATDDVVADVDVGVCGTNGGGDREGDDGGEEDELHVGLTV
jgi:hypothetical protein